MIPLNEDCGLGFPHVGLFWTPTERKMAKIYGEMVFFHTQLRFNTELKRTDAEVHEIVSKYLDKSDEFYKLIKSVN